MAPKKDSQIVNVTLPKFHLMKLDILCKRTGLSKSGVMQRLLENYKVFEIQDDGPANEAGPPKED